MKENQKGAGRFTVPWTAPLQKQKEGNAVYLTIVIGNLIKKFSIFLP